MLKEKLNKYTTAPTPSAPTVPQIDTSPSVTQLVDKTREMTLGGNNTSNMYGPQPTASPLTPSTYSTQSQPYSTTLAQPTAYTNFTMPQQQQQLQQQYQLPNPNHQHNNNNSNNQIHYNVLHLILPIQQLLILHYRHLLMHKVVQLHLLLCHQRRISIGHHHYRLCHPIHPITCMAVLQCLFQCRHPHQ